MSKHGRITGGSNQAYNIHPGISGLDPVAGEGESFPYSAVVIVFTIGLSIGVAAVLFAPFMNRLFHP